jgi:hypothetical protein
MWLSYFLLGHSFNESLYTVTLTWGLQSVWLTSLFFYCKTHWFSSYVLWILKDIPYFKALSCHLPKEMKVNDNLNQDSQLAWFNTEIIYNFSHMCPFSRTSINPFTAMCSYRSTAVKIPILLNDVTWPLVIRQFRGFVISHKAHQKWELIRNMALKGNRLEDTYLPGCDAVSFSKCFSIQCHNHQCQKVQKTWILNNTSNASSRTTGLRLTFLWRNSQGSVISCRCGIWINSCNLWQW